MPEKTKAGSLYIFWPRDAMDKSPSPKLRRIRSPARWAMACQAAVAQAQGPPNFKNGEIVGAQEGVVPKQVLVDKLEAIL